MLSETFQKVIHHAQREQAEKKRQRQKPQNIIDRRKVPSEYKIDDQDQYCDPEDLEERFLFHQSILDEFIPLFHLFRIFRETLINKGNVNYRVGKTVSQVELSCGSGG